MAFCEELLMMQLVANLSTLYDDLPVQARFAAARQDGFQAVEILRPYDQTPEWYAGQLQENDLELVLINTPSISPDHPVGLAAQPGLESEFRRAMEQAAEVCRACGCPAVHVMAGRRDTHVPHDRQLQVLLENLRWAAQQFPDLRLQLEALNSKDMPDYFYSQPGQVAQVLEQAGQPALRMQFDFYHVIKEGLALVDSLEQHMRWVSHIQVAGSPERHEPDLRRDTLMAGFEFLDTHGYTALVGLEYYPRARVADGLAWVQPLLDSGWARF
ncbi:MAG: TIM barrel protein [Castellaniella sp.]